MSDPVVVWDGVPRGFNPRDRFRVVRRLDATDPDRLVMVVEGAQEDAMGVISWRETVREPIQVAVLAAALLEVHGRLTVPRGFGGYR